MICQMLKEAIKSALNISDFNIVEIRGGMSKQVYRIITQADNFILYIWRRPYDNKLTENRTKGIEYLFPDGFSYFMHNTELLADLGIRVPYVLAAGHHDGDFDYAIVECFKGQSLGDWMRNGENIGAVADKITAVMDKMAAKKRAFYGPPMESKPKDAIPLPKSINAAKLEFYKLCWKIEYVSVAVDYLMHVDSSNEWFKNSRESNLRELKKML